MFQVNRHDLNGGTCQAAPDKGQAAVCHSVFRHVVHQLEVESSSSTLLLISELLLPELKCQISFGKISICSMRFVQGKSDRPKLSSNGAYVFGPNCLFDFAEFSGHPSIIRRLLCFSFSHWFQPDILGLGISMDISVDATLLTAVFDFVLLLLVLYIVPKLFRNKPDNAPHLAHYPDDELTACSEPGCVRCGGISNSLLSVDLLTKLNCRNVDDSVLNDMLLKYDTMQQLEFYPQNWICLLGLFLDNVFSSVTTLIFSGHSQTWKYQELRS